MGRRLVKAKKKCCSSKPRCKRCPVVLKRLSRHELAIRHEKRVYELNRDLDPKAWKAARRSAKAPK